MGSERRWRRRSDARGDGGGVGHEQLEVLRRQTVDQRGRVHQVRDHDDGALVPPAGGGDGVARQRLELAQDRRSDRIGERGVIRDQDGLCELVVLGLA